MATQMQLDGAGEGPAKEKRIFPSPSSFFRPSACSKGCYFYSPESSSDIKPKIAASTVRT